MDKTQNRSFYWDNIKGFLMLLTVFAHILLPFQSNAVINGIFDYIYMFHMPAFVFLSGYFGKSEKSRSFEAVIRLAFLYFIFNSVMGFVFGFDSLLEPMYSYWYLIALIVWRLTAHHFAKFKDITLILGVIAVFAGFFPSVDNSFAIARIIGFYPFYMAGYMLSAEKGNAAAEGKYSFRFLKGLLWLAGVITAAVLARSIFRYTDASLQMFGYAEPLDVFGRIVLFGIAAMAVKTLRQLAPNRKIQLISMFGRNSLWIFLLHRPVTLVISNMLENCSSTAVIAVSFAAALIICVLFGNNYIAKPLNRFAQNGAEIFTSDDKSFSFAKLAALAVAIGFAVSAVASVYSDDIVVDETVEPQSADVMYNVMNREQQEAFENAFFAGDLI